MYRQAIWLFPRLLQSAHEPAAAGLEFVGMSSVGPSMVIVTDRSREEVAKVIEPLGLEIAIETEVDNEGMKW